MDMKDENDTENRLKDEHYNLIKSYKEYFEDLFDCIQFEDIAINPTGIRNQVTKYAEENGKWIEYEKKIEGKSRVIKYYKPNNTNEYVLIIIDHIGLLGGERSMNKKGLIDKMDEYLVSLRNRYKYIPVVVSQFNRELGDIQRQRFKELTPQLEDYKDSGNTQESANVVFSLFHPKRYNLDNYLGYKLKGEVDGKFIIDYFRAGFILKNRGGRDGLRIGMRFLGTSGYFEEIPIPTEFEKNPNWYKRMVDFSKPFNELIQ